MLEENFLADETGEESNYFLINKNTHERLWEVYLKDREYTEKVFILSRDVPPEEGLGFKSERAFILTDGYNLNYLRILIGEELEDYEINALYMHRRFLDKEPHSNERIIDDLLETYKNIFIGIKTGGSIQTIPQCADEENERVEEIDLKEIEADLLPSMGWGLDKDFPKTARLRETFLFE